MPRSRDLLSLVKRQLDYCCRRTAEPGFADDLQAVSEVRGVIEDLHAAFVLMDPSADASGSVPGIARSLALIDEGD